MNIYHKFQGSEEFEDQVMHSARWNHEVNLDNQRVVVVGSGASAIQLVPEIAKTAKSLTVLQRSAPYILPRPDTTLYRVQKSSFSVKIRTVCRHSDTRCSGAMNTILPNVVIWKVRLSGSKKNCLQFLKHQIAEPELQRKLTPNYEPGCKRLLLSNDYYPTFLKPHVMLEDFSISTSNQRWRDKSGPDMNSLADIIVFATGFEAARPPYAAKVVGKHGLSLEQQWSSGMRVISLRPYIIFQTYLFWMGRNTGSGHNSALYFLETQFDLVLDALQFFEQEQIQVFEADQERWK